MVDRRGGRQSGQALVEYQVLFPGTIILVVGILLTFGNQIRDVFDDVTDVFTGEDRGTSLVCVEWVTQERGGSYCDQHPLCDLIEEGGATCGGTGFSNCYVHFDVAPEFVVVKAAQDYHYYLNPESAYYEADMTPDGPTCYVVTVTPDTITGEGVLLNWRLDTSEPDCQDVSHVQAWGPGSIEEECAEYKER
jgi:hypothetical protein